MWINVKLFLIELDCRKSNGDKRYASLFIQQGGRPFDNQTRLTHTNVVFADRIYFFYGTARVPDTPAFHCQYWLAAAERGRICQFYRTPGHVNGDQYIRWSVQWHLTVAGRKTWHLSFFVFNLSWYYIKRTTRF